MSWCHGVWSCQTHRTTWEAHLVPHLDLCTEIKHLKLRGKKEKLKFVEHLLKSKHYIHSIATLQGLL